MSLTIDGPLHIAISEQKAHGTTGSGSTQPISITALLVQKKGNVSAEKAFIQSRVIYITFRIRQSSLGVMCI